jgi:hypothetical protein
MLDGDFLDKLNNVAQGIRKNTKPFGGIQVELYSWMDALYLIAFV